MKTRTRHLIHGLLKQMVYCHINTSQQKLWLWRISGKNDSYVSRTWMCKSCLPWILEALYAFLWVYVHVDQELYEKRSLELDQFRVFIYLAFSERRQMVFAGRQNSLKWTSFLQKRSYRQSNQVGKTILTAGNFATQPLRKPLNHGTVKETEKETFYQGKVRKFWWVISMATMYVY